MSKKVSRSSLKGKKWVVALDPFSDLDISMIVGFAKPFVENSGASLLGAYVLAPESFNWIGEFSGPWLKKYKPLADEKCQDLMTSYGFNIEVVPCRQAGLRSSVYTFLQFIKKVNAEGIVLSTHGRSGLERWALGSFAETVIMSTKKPVLVLNPTQPLPTLAKKIIVPTDLSKGSERFVLKLIPFAKGQGASLVIYYKEPDPLDPIIQQGVYSLGGGWVSMQSYMDTEIKAKREQLSKLAEHIRKKGVECDVFADESAGALVDGINQAVTSKKADMIAVLTKSGPVSAAILGSVARGLVRTSAVPVYICRG